nr:MAG TPA: hypothetical protein [Caudoviricetes sp.]
MASSNTIPILFSLICKYNFIKNSRLFYLVAVQ